MREDGKIGGSIECTDGTELASISEQVAAAKRVGYDGVWTTEVSRDSFLSLLLAAERSPGAEAGHRDGGGVRRNPMTVATIANDLQRGLRRLARR
jgi:hypothetical protein